MPRRTYSTRPTVKRVGLSVTISEETRIELEREAEARGVSAAWIIRECIARSLPTLIEARKSGLPDATKHIGS